MTPRSPWIVVPVTVTAGLVLYLWLAWGDPGLSGLFLLLFLAVAFGGPLFAAIQLGGQAVESPPFRRRLFALLAFPAGAGLLMGGMAGIEGGLFFALTLVFLATAALAACAFLTTAASRPGGPGREGVKEASRSLWTLVLAGAVFCCVSLPAAWAVEAYTIGRAKAWVEAAAAEVRAVERSTGRLPADLAEILPLAGAARRTAGTDRPPKLGPSSSSSWIATESSTPAGGSLTGAPASGAGSATSLAGPTTPGAWGKLPGCTGGGGRVPYAATPCSSGPRP
jgi:hypothetical protein